MSKGLPAKLNGKDIARPIRKWWATNKPTDILAQTDLLQAARDVGLVSLAYLMRQLQNPKVDDATKRNIALAMAMRPPKLVVVGNPPAREPGDAAGDLLKSYAVDD